MASDVPYLKDESSSRALFGFNFIFNFIITSQNLSYNGILLCTLSVSSVFFILSAHSVVVLKVHDKQ